VAVDCPFYAVVDARITFRSVCTPGGKGERSAAWRGGISGMAQPRKKVHGVGLAA
jgi:hypothetical protein